MTYVALLLLLILGDDLSRVNKRGIIESMKRLQQPDGRYLAFAQLDNRYGGPQTLDFVTNVDSVVVSQQLLAAMKAMPASCTALASFHTLSMTGAALTETRPRNTCSIHKATTEVSHKVLVKSHTVAALTAPLQRCI